MPVIHALGTSVRVDLGTEIDRSEFDAAWSRCLGPSDHTTDGPDADLPLIEGQSSMTTLTQFITRALIRRRAGELLMLHAGAVCHPDTGRSVTYLAPGGTGKTTLTRLLGQDYGYLTDETVGIEPGTWRILPYEKPLSLRAEDGGFPKSERGPDSLGLNPAHQSPTLSALAVIRRSPAFADAPSITQPDFLDIVPSLVPETSSLAHLERPLHLLADLFEALGGFWLADYAEAEQLREWVIEQVGEP